MNTYILIFILSLCLSLLLTPVVRRLCERYGWLDVPRDQRRVHRKATPRLGGVAVVTSMLTALMALLWVNNSVTWSLWEERSKLFVALAPAAIIFLVGVYDDMYGISPRVKFAAQGLAASLFFALGGRIEILSVSFAGAIRLPVVVSFVVTVVWIVAITNAFNLIDGIDGLAAGAGLFASLVMIVVSIVTGHSFVTVIALAMAGALIGFLRYNFNPASIFLGDSGSLFVGFTLATLSVQGTQKASTVVALAIPLLAFGLPIIDTSLALLRRFTSGRPLFAGDKEHIHHKLLARGWSQRRVVLVLYGACALLGLQALLFVQEWGVSRLTGLWLLVVGVAVTVAVDRLHYHEVDEIRDGLKRNLSLAEFRLRLANNVRVRRSGQALSEAETLADVFDAVKEMLELNSFVYATVQINHAGTGALCRGKQAGSLPPNTQAHNGCIYWAWESGKLGTAEILKSSRLWSLSLSLSTKETQWGYINLYRGIDSENLLIDINYLNNFFQNQMALAVERVVSRETEKANVRPVEQQTITESVGSVNATALLKVSGF
ncbi:MAG: undecaprenyl/decaprenyl-phosphate alpha-N-acetylglucosaminyl 1-phosphate transferase [Acidobacteria bacterium]|nr:undecaprenyl/decaprenyl-phosphate alpha-N-acetylglucosaminyl 1-phosphate transferase [Acidobacteriota bacterium]